MNISGTTGEKVREAGLYQNKYGKKISLDTNAVFPPCPVKGNSIKWDKVEH